MKDSTFAKRPPIPDVPHDPVAAANAARDARDMGAGDIPRKHKPVADKAQVIIPQGSNKEKREKIPFIKGPCSGRPTCRCLQCSLRLMGTPEQDIPERNPE